MTSARKQSASSAVVAPPPPPAGLPDTFTLNVRRIPGGWAVTYSAFVPPVVGAGPLGLFSALAGAVAALRKGGAR